MTKEIKFLLLKQTVRGLLTSPAAQLFKDIPKRLEIKRDNFRTVLLNQSRPFFGWR